MTSTETKALNIRTINNFAAIISNLLDEALGQERQNEIKVAPLLNLRYYAHMLENIVEEALDYALKQED